MKLTILLIIVKKIFSSLFDFFDYLSLIDHSNSLQCSYLSPMIFSDSLKDR